MGKPTCESTIALNINRLTRAGIFRGVEACLITYSCSDEVYGRVAATVLSPSTLRLVLFVRRKKFEHVISLSYSSCSYGGERPWFTCPCCNRRVGTLLLTNGRFVCRHCGGYCYQTQLEQPTGRHIIRGQRLMQRIGGLCECDEPDRPKGMHRKTYERLYARAEAAFDRSWAPDIEKLENGTSSP